MLLILPTMGREQRKPRRPPTPESEERTIRGDLIRILREAKRWSVDQLAERSGVSRRTVELAEKSIDIKSSTINRLARGLGVEPRVLMDFDIVVPTLEEMVYESVNHRAARPVKLPLPAAEASTPRLP